MPGGMDHVGHIIYKVLTQKGAEGWDSLSVGWEPWHEARPVIRARVIAPDFTVHTLDPNTITEAPARGGDYKDLQRRQAAACAFSGHCAGRGGGRGIYRDRNGAAVSPGRVGRIVLGQEDVPVAHSRVVFDAPAALPLRTDLLLLPGCQARAHRVRWARDAYVRCRPARWRRWREPYLPPDVVRFPMIDFSTGASWQSIAAEYGKIVDDSPIPRR